MNMKYHRIILIFISTFFVLISTHAQDLDDKYYTNKSLSDFIGAERVNMTINPDSFDLELLNALLFHLTNKERLTYKRNTLTFHLNLKKSSQYHSNEMAENTFFSHQNKKNRKMREPSDRIYYYQDDYTAIGENIVANNLYEYSGKYLEYQVEEQEGRRALRSPNGDELKYSTYINLARRLMKQWMDSPPHKKNILSRNYRLLGCACALDDSEELIKVKCTQNFGDR